MSQINTNSFPIAAVQKGGRVAVARPLNSAMPNFSEQTMSKTPFMAKKTVLPQTPYTTNTSKSPKFNVGVESDESGIPDVSMWTPGAIQNSNILTTYSYIRFNLFPTIEKTVMKDLLIKLANIPLKHEKITPEFLMALQTRNFDDVYQFAEKYEIKDFDEQLRKQVGGKVFVPDMDTIMDIYMENDNQKIASSILATLLSSSPMNEEEWQNIINSYKSRPVDLKFTFIDKCYNMPNL